MAGSDPSFVPIDFRTNIRATMLMALPEAPADRPVFRFKRTVTVANHDSGGKPFDYHSATETKTQKPDVLCGTKSSQVLFIWDAGGAGRKVVGETPFGDFDPSRLTLTFLDVDYQKIKGFESVLMYGNEYFYEKEDPLINLHEVGIHQIVVVARDES